MIYTVDAFEEEYATLQSENRESRCVFADELPVGCREGDVVENKDGKWVINREITCMRKNEIKKILNNIIKKEK